MLNYQRIHLLLHRQYHNITLLDSYQWPEVPSACTSTGRPDKVFLLTLLRYLCGVSIFRIFHSAAGGNVRVGRVELFRLLGPSFSHEKLSYILLPRIKRYMISLLKNAFFRGHKKTGQRNGKGACLSKQRLGEASCLCSIKLFFATCYEN